MDDILDELRSEAAERIREGFDSRADIIENLGHVACESHGVEFEEDVLARIVDQELLEHYGRQETWTEPTDCDKLDAAFAAMEMRGIVARQNFTCCSNCGHSEIGAEIDAEKACRKLIGYAFYHMQDTERATQGGSIYIKFGTVGDTAEEEVGGHIADVIAASGLEVDWNGSADSAVEVKIADWRKRRVNELPLTDEPD